MADRRENFLRKEVPERLKNLKPDTKPEWGYLTAQAMVEHLVGSWRISNGKASAECKVPEDKLEKLRAFLFSDKAFEKNVKNPLLPEDAPPPHRKPDLQSAVDQLLQEIADFFEYHQKHPDARPVHPIFGELDKEGWLIFQEKHIKHHFRQFKL